MMFAEEEKNRSKKIFAGNFFCPNNYFRQWYLQRCIMHHASCISIEDCLSSKVVCHRRSSSINGHLPFYPQPQPLKPLPYQLQLSKPLQKLIVTGRQTGGQKKSLIGAQACAAQKLGLSCIKLKLVLRSYSKLIMLELKLKLQLYQSGWVGCQIK